VRRDLPAGDVTFLFTDIEGSTRLLHELGAERYADALAEHRSVLRSTFDAHGGVEVDTQGDAFFVAFQSAAGALAAAALTVESLRDGPIRVRMGLHTGRPLVTTEGYVGPDVHRAARIAAAGHGGQVLLSKETRDLVRGDFVDLGEHRLKDIAGPVWIFQLGDDRFPPLSTIANSNLPRPASIFVGRETELREVTSLLSDGARLLTLTGPGGSGKTRLAIEAAAQLVPEFKAGVFWVELAPVRDPALVSDTIAQALGAKQGLAQHIGERQLMLLLDNLEQVIAAGAELATLVEACPNLRLLVTSRELLRVRGEREYPVSPLADDEAVALFCDRASVTPDSTVRELCRALDNLPLAVELAAARAAVLTPRQILARLSGRLDLLKGGRDADPRQQTLRATMEWSHDLLSPSEQALFVRMSVFAGGCTVDAAEAVAAADLDALQSLVDKSLLRHVDDRFWMLESIRAYAAERLDQARETEELRRRHARYYLDLTKRLDAVLASGEPEEGPVFVLESEINNLRAAVDFGLSNGDTNLVREITVALPFYWLVRGLYTEGRSWLDRALALDDAHDQTRRRLLSNLGIIAYIQGDHVTAVEATDAAAVLAVELGGATERMALLRDLASTELMKPDYDAAEALYTERLGLAIELDNGVSTSACRLSLAYIANKTQRQDLAEALLNENLRFVRSKGQTRCEATTLADLATIRLQRGLDATADAVLATTLAIQIRAHPLTVDCLELIAAFAASRGDVERAATVLAATEAIREATDMPPDEDEAAVRQTAIDRLGAPPAAFADAWKFGRSLDAVGAFEFAKAAGP
jgi:predicted ATPase